MINCLGRLGLSGQGDEAKNGQSYRTKPYDEATFQAFLEIERERSRRSGRSFFLLLVDFVDPPHSNGLTLGEGTASTLFDGLADVLRETDYVGWYRRSLVVGAVLTQLSDRESGDSLATALRRARETLVNRLPAEAGAHARFRVLEYGKDGVGMERGL